MSLIIRDSFDPYAKAADLQFTWDSPYVADTTFFNLVSGASTRFGVGQAISTFNNFGGRIQLYQNFRSNQSTIFVVFAHFSGGLTGTAAEDYCFRFYDGATTQCCVNFCSNGDIRVYRGDPYTGANKVLLHTFTATYSGLVWTHWQIKVVIDNTAGEVHIRKNGNSVDDYVVTGLDLTTTANNYINAFDLGAVAQGIQRITDDLVIYSGDGLGAPWNDWVGDIRAEQMPPSSDTAQKDFTPSASTILFGDNNPTAGAGATSNGLIYFYPVVAGATGQVDANGIVNFFTAPGVTKHFTVGLYDSDGAAGAPNTLLATAAQVTTTSGTVGQYVTYPFVLGSSPNVVRGHTYYWGIAADNPFEVNRDNGASSSTYRATFTYSSTLPSTVTSPIANGTQTPICIHSVIENLTNSGLVSELIYDTSSTFVQNATANDFDLYDVSGMTNTPSTIFGVSVRMLMAKTDSDFREATATLKSAGVEVDGRTINLGSDWQLFDFPVDMDPATGLPWTAAAVNNLTFGPKVVA